MGRKTKKAKRYENTGQPTKMNDNTLKLLEEIFEIGGSDTEACLHANISTQTLYNYQKKNPKYVERKATLKETPTLQARREVVKGLIGNHDFSLKYLERKKKNEFSTSQNMKLSGDKDHPIATNMTVTFVDKK